MKYQTRPVAPTYVDAVKLPDAVKQLACWSNPDGPPVILRDLAIGSAEPKWLVVHEDGTMEILPETMFTERYVPASGPVVSDSTFTERYLTPSGDFISRT